ncbi:MAG: malate synthase A [Thermoplasmata archaeon]|jgi:malate synthase
MNARKPSRRRTRTHAPLRVKGTSRPRFEEILTPEALDFLSELDVRFEPTRRRLLSLRGGFRAALRAGTRPGFLPETRTIRTSDWKVPAPPPDLTDRRVEITGPVDRKMIINALNSGAKVFMADFEDSHSPTWVGTVAGQVNLWDAVRRRIDYQSPDGRGYRLKDRTATLMVRPRGWHLEERHVQREGRPISASLFDYGLFLFHNAAELRRRGSAPYFYLPKLEHYLEARLWNDVFSASEDRLGLPPGTIRATALIETLPAAVQMHEILWELREHSVGLNCGRWDYLFSFIKQFRDDPNALFPDRSLLTMTTPFLTAYARLLIATCHRRGAHAMGGMAAQIPIKDDPAANAEAIARVVADKEREVRFGHDGTWVAHPGLVPIAQRVFDARMPGPNQIDRPTRGAAIRARELIAVPTGPTTSEGVRRNTRVALRYLEAWLRGIGCVPIDHLMEDAATVEIARSQLWQWIHHHAPLEGGGFVGRDVFRKHLASEIRAFRAEEAGVGTLHSLRRAGVLLDRVVTSRSFAEFIPQLVYPELRDAPEAVGT